MLQEALTVVTAWGFVYRTHFVWVKDKAATGYWNRNKHEILLLATKGDIPAPPPGTQCDSIVEAPTGKHSEKPKVFYELIERYFPDLPKIELFARGKPRSGWQNWGKEAEDE
jgi:N6-adenosine-specific RNA methylase IME4